MAKVAQEMIHAALDAFVAFDADAAQKVAARDDELDGLYQQVFRELLTYMLEDPRTISRATLFAVGGAQPGAHWRPRDECLRTRGVYGARASWRSFSPSRLTDRGKVL